MGFYSCCSSILEFELITSLLVLINSTYWGQYEGPDSDGTTVFLFANTVLQPYLLSLGVFRLCSLRGYETLLFLVTCFL